MWAEAYTKTTIKGFGRQFYARAEGEPLWHRSIHGGARSGRLGTTDIQGEEVYPAEARDSAVLETLEPITVPHEEAPAVDDLARWDDLDPDNQL